MTSYGLHSAGLFTRGLGSALDDKAGYLPQAMWYFRSEWVAVPASEQGACRFCPVFPVDRDWSMAAAAGPSGLAEGAGLPLLVWVAAPDCIDGASLDARATQITHAGGRVAFSLVPRLPLNGAWFNEDSASFFHARSLRVRGCHGATGFIARTLWPEDYALPVQVPLVASDDGSKGDLGTWQHWVRSPNMGFSAEAIWQQRPGSSLQPGQPVFGVMLNGAQSDDDEAHGGHFALISGRVGPAGSLADLLVYNFYTLDSESEKGIIASPVPLDNYLGDLNSGQAWYRPSWLLLVTLADERLPRRLDALMARVFAQFYRHCFSYQHARANCTGISVRCLRALGWPVPAAGAESWLLGFLALPLTAIKTRSLAKGKATFDYLSEDRSILYPAEAFTQIAADLIRRVRGELSPTSAWTQALAEDALQVLRVQIPQFPSSRALGTWPVANSREYRQRVPADPARRKIIPVPLRSFPAELRDPQAPAEPPLRSDYAWRLWQFLIFVMTLLIFVRLWA